MAAVVSGAIVGRMKTKAWVLFIILWATLVYVPICHWIWGGGWLMNMGAIDFAGGVAVEVNSGFSALALALILGKRKDTSLLPHNLGYSVLGAGFLWFGWMGFNGGSALAANGLAGLAILVVTEKGYGKKTKLEEYRMTHRGSKGVKALNITEKNGNIVAFKTIHNEEDVMIVTNSGIIIRMPSLQISTTGRVAQGVKLINLKGDQKVSTVETS